MRTAAHITEIPAAFAAVIVSVNVYSGRLAVTVEYGASAQRLYLLIGRLHIVKIIV